MASISAQIPPPPPGFELIPMEGASGGSDIPPPPPGFELIGPDPVAQPSRARTIAQGFADTATFGLADEAAAAVGTLGGMLPGGHGKGYSELLEEIRGQAETDAEAHPYAHLGGQVAGGVGNAVGLVRGGLSLAANAAQAGKGWLPRLLGGSADGAISAVLYGAGNGEDPRDRAWQAINNAPWGAGMGVAGELAATTAGAGFRRLFQGASDVAPGINPAANVAEAQQFGIPLSRAQATRSIGQANIEDQLRSQGGMQSFDDAQRAALGQSVDDMQSRIAGQQPRIAGQASAYETVPGALRGKRDALKAASQDAYEASVNNPDVLVSGEAVADLPTFISQRLADESIIVDPLYHQGASRALNFIDDYISRMPKPTGDVTDVQAQLRWIENMRAGVRKNFPPMGPDAPALRQISSAIDAWTDDIFDRGLVSASDDVLAELKTARAKWSEYKAMAEPKSKIGNSLNPRYEAQARLRAIVEKDMSPEEVGKLLWGSSVASPKGSAVMTAAELKKHLGADSSHWSGIRQSFWLRATRANDETLNPTQIAKNLDGLLKGDGAGVAKILFSEEERQLMTAYTNVMRAMSANRTGQNFSNTANRLVPTLQKYAQGIISALAAGGGHMGGLGPLESLGLGALAGTATRTASGVARTSRARAATMRPVPTNPSGTGGAVLRGGALPAIGQDRHPLQITVGRPRP